MIDYKQLEKNKEKFKNIYSESKSFECLVIDNSLMPEALDEFKIDKFREQRKGEMMQTKKNERANVLQEVKRLCKEFGFTAGMLKGALAEGRKKS